MAGQGSFLITLQRKEVVTANLMFLFSGAISAKIIKMRNFLKNIYRYSGTLGDFLKVNKQPAATTYSTAEKIRIYTAIEVEFVTPEMCSKIPSSIQKEGI